VAAVTREPIGERMMRVETEMTALKVGQDQILKRLDTHDAATAALSAKLDLIIANQGANATTTQSAIEAVKAEVAAMKPDVQTVADIKKLGSLGKWSVGIGASILATFVWAKGWIILNWNWFLGVPPR
jgi:hypothetical protein